MINHRHRLATIQCSEFTTLWDLNEPTHCSKRVFDLNCILQCSWLKYCPLMVITLTNIIMNFTIIIDHTSYVLYCNSNKSPTPIILCHSAVLWKKLAYLQVFQIPPKSNEISSVHKKKDRAQSRIQGPINWPVLIP